MNEVDCFRPENCLFPCYARINFQSHDIVLHTKWDVKAFPVPLYLTNRLLEQYTKNLKLKAIIFCDFNWNGSNKVAIELSGVQFRTEIILVIWNRTRAARSFDFEIKRMILDQIALNPLSSITIIYQTHRWPRLFTAVVSIKNVRKTV